MSERGAVMQFEVNYERAAKTKEDGTYSGQFIGETPWGRIKGIATTSVLDTIMHGGTFVLVCDKAKKTITMVQRPDVE